HYRPPGPVIVLMSFFDAAEDDHEGESGRPVERSSRSPSLRVGSSDQGDSSDNEPADNIWQPLWPEIGLARSLHFQLRALPRTQTILYDLISARAGRWMERPG